MCGCAHAQSPSLRFQIFLFIYLAFFFCLVLKWKSKTKFEKRTHNVMTMAKPNEITKPLTIVATQAHEQKKIGLRLCFAKNVWMSLKFVPQHTLRYCLSLPVSRLLARSLCVVLHACVCVFATLICNVTVWNNAFDIELLPTYWVIAAKKPIVARATCNESCACLIVSHTCTRTTVPLFEYVVRVCLPATASWRVSEWLNEWMNRWMRIVF